MKGLNLFSEFVESVIDYDALMLQQKRASERLERLACTLRDDDTEVRIMFLPSVEIYYQEDGGSAVGQLTELHYHPVPLVGQLVGHKQFSSLWISGRGYAQIEPRWFILVKTRGELYPYAVPIEDIDLRQSCVLGFAGVS